MELQNGDFEIVFADEVRMDSTNYSLERFLPRQRQPLSWDNAFHIMVADEDDSKMPTMKLNIKWTKNRVVDEWNKENVIGPRKRRSNRRSAGNNNSSTSLTRANGGFQRLVYQFVYKNFRLKTEMWNCYDCPWCALFCYNLYALLKHLTLCHDQFKFRYNFASNETQIDVSLNNSYESTYLGSENDLIGPRSTKFCNEEPHRRVVATRLLVCHPQRNKPRVSEFWRNDELHRSRVYYHSVTGLPVYQSEFDEDSEDDTNPDWLQKNTRQMIDEFTDVNGGEKNIMQIWNAHVMHMGYIADAQMGMALEDFVEQRGEEILQKNLYRNFVLHCTNMADYGLISTTIFLKVIVKIQKMLSSNENLRNAIASGLNGQRECFKVLTRVPDESRMTSVRDSLNENGKRMRSGSTGRANRRVSRTDSFIRRLSLRAVRKSAVHRI